MSPANSHERAGEGTIEPAEVWEQLSPDVQARVCSLLARMAYKYALAQRGSLSKEDGVENEVQSHKSENHA